ncbi:MAG: hypothetical protein ACREJ3_12170 [Polyangiaceae bacterium]
MKQSNEWDSPRRLIRPPHDAAVAGMRAMKAIGSAGAQGLRPGARRLISAAQRMLLGTAEDIDALGPIAPAELAAAIPEPLREQLARAMVLITLTDGPPHPAAAEQLRGFARALGVDERAIETVHLFASGHMLLGVLDYHRRSNIRDMAATEIADHGLFRGVRALLGVRGLIEDPLVAEPFRALADLPAGSLGRELFDHYRRNGFALPGEKHGFPEAGVYHDFTHVLAGYGTEPLGEIQVAAFTAGYRKKDPLVVAMLPLLVFCADINVTPIPHEHIDALFAQPGTAERYLRAIERGGEVTTDLSDHWDFWPLVRRPLEEVRRELGVAPLGPV